MIFTVATPVDLREAVFQLFVSEIVEFSGGHGAGEDDINNGHDRRIIPLDEREVCIFRQIVQDAVNLVLDLRTRELHVLTHFKHNLDERDILHRIRLDIIDLAH